MNIKHLGIFLKITAGLGIILASGCHSGDRHLRFMVTHMPWPAYKGGGVEKQARIQQFLVSRKKLS